MWSLGFELRSLGLAANTSTHGTILPNLFDLGGLGGAWSHYVAQACLELSIYLSQLPQN